MTKVMFSVYLSVHGGGGVGTCSSKIFVTRCPTDLGGIFYLEKTNFFTFFFLFWQETFFGGDFFLGGGGASEVKLEVNQLEVDPVGRGAGGTPVAVTQVDCLVCL